MKPKHTEPYFSHSDLEAVGHLLEDGATHRELDGLISDCGLFEPVGPLGLSKAKRIVNALAHAQSQTQTGNLTMKFIQAVMAPRRFLSRVEVFDRLRANINEFLSFRGWHLLEGGKFSRVAEAQTITEAQERADKLRSELERRKVHPDVLAFCTAELVQNNYFHATLEATKSVSDKLRKLTGLSGDAGTLAQEALMPGKDKSPRLPLNSMSSDSDLSEQKGLANLFVGMFGAFRNTTAHAPKISWPVTEQDALDLLTLVSFLHRRLDAAATISQQLDDTV